MYKKYKTTAMLWAYLKYLPVLFLCFSFTKTVAQPAESIELKDLTKTEKSTLPPGWDYQSTSSNPHGIIVVLAANPRINEIPLKYGDFIGAFYLDDFGEMKCGGADFWTDTDNIIFPVFGNDNATPEKDGFGYGELMNFKVFYQDTQKEYAVDNLQWDPEYATDDNWYPLGLSSITDLSCNIVFDAYATISPNPICIGEMVNLNANIFIETTGSYTYLWSSIPEGFTSSLINTTDTPQTNIIYILEVTDGLNVSNHETALTVNGNPEVQTGDNPTICTNQSAEITATANSHSSVIWATQGDGTFQDSDSLSAIYFPGDLDIESGQAFLTITAYPINPCTAESSDETIISLAPLPVVNSPLSLVFCENQEMIIEAQAENYTSAEWVTNGDGTFENPYSLTTQYFPGTSDLDLNEFILTACVSAISPCLLGACTNIQVNTYDVPSVNVPGSRTSCEDTPVNINSIAFNYSSSIWTTQGDGTFANPGILSTKYYPGSEDISNNGTIVTIHVYGNGLCENYPVSKNIEIILIPLPQAIAGEDSDICDGGTVPLAGSAFNNTYVIWSTDGDGFFSNSNDLNAVYFPGNEDFSSQNFDLFLSAHAGYPCNNSITDTMSVNVLPNPEVEIGINEDLICFGDNYYFDQTTLSYSSSMEWFTINGGGTFDDNSLLHPTYYPNPEIDYLLGCIFVGVLAYPEEPCTITADDYMSFCFNAPPEVYAGDDATIITGEPYTPNAIASNYSSIIWETAGDGTFINPTEVLTQYYPGAMDAENYFVRLNITALPNSECNVSVTDTINLVVLKNQQIVLAEGITGLSTYIDVTDKSFEDVITPVSGELIFAQKFTQVYWPEYNINTIDDFSNLFGYKVIMSTGATLQIAGYEVTDKSIYLNDGWNILPVLTACNINSEYLINQLGSALIIITEMNGNAVVWPEGNVVTLEELIPGKAYMIKVNPGVILSYPDCNK